MAISKKLGNQFEKEFCETLYNHGFWCHKMAQNAAGQPADVIAVRNGQAYLIDCKVCTHGRFPLSRIEENQRFAMEIWEERGNTCCWFALKTPKGVIMLEYWRLRNTLCERSILNIDDINSLGITLERWLEIC